MLAPRVAAQRVGFEEGSGLLLPRDELHPVGLPLKGILV